MEIKESRIPDVKIIKPRIFEDDRGYFFESYRESVLREAGVELSFVQDNVSASVKGTLRGLHYQIVQPQAKLIQCLKGEILDVAVDIRRSSPTFGEHISYILSEENHHGLLIPEGFAHGFSVLSEEAVISYKCSDYYNKSGERGILWNDPGLNINWQTEQPVLSEKDRQNPLFSSIKEEDLFI